MFTKFRKIFDLYPEDGVVPYFTKGVYDFMYWDGVGNTGDDLTKTLEHPICELYNIDQSFRFQSGYRQTGYYIAGQNSVPFISEWMEMCSNPIIKNETVKYAAYHEETVVNCLLWKHKVKRGLPSVYVNGSLDIIDLINNEYTFTGEPRYIKEWLLLPAKKEELFFIHGEKRLNIIDEMINKLNNMRKKLRLLFITPHLSTGGMPQFVLKRIQELQKYKDDVELFLVEYSQFSYEYVVQRNQIIELLGEGHFWSLGYPAESELKPQLIDIIKNNNIDIIHFEEISEAFEGFNRIPLELLNEVFSNNRTWKIIESCHNVWFDPTNRKYHPDAYTFVTPHHLDTFITETSYKELHQYPYEDKVKPILQKHQIFTDEHKVPMIEKIYVREELGLDPFKTHVMNVGLWTSGKNQKEGVEIARNVWEKNKDVVFHFIGNQAPNFEEYWGPIMSDLPPNVKVWGERNDVDKFMTACDVLMFNSTWECNPLVVREAINYGMKIITRDLPQYKGMFDGYITKIIEDDNLIENTSNTLLDLIISKETYKIKQEENFGDSLFQFYNKVYSQIPSYTNTEVKNDYSILNHYIINPYLEINGQTDNPLNVRFYDENELAYESNIGINSWIKMNKEYYTKWKVEVRENDKLIYQSSNNYKDKKVFISFASSSLGDTLAWLPYCEEFRKKHGCKLVVSTFMNYLFKDQYPEIEFAEREEVVHGITAQYNIGWFYDDQSNYDFNKHPQDFKKIPLQQTASDILGLPYEEIRPKLNLPKVEKKKKVGIGFHSTAQAKYWNNSVGWQKVIDYLNNLGYECMIYSREGDGYMGNFYPKGVTTFSGGTIQEVINDLSTCEFFIGLGSGLSWLAWACELPVVLISGFSDRLSETTLDTYRVINEDVCHGCFKKVRLDAGDWNWCPFHKDTERQFECTKEISSDMVIGKIDEMFRMRENPYQDFDWGISNGWYRNSILDEIFQQKIYERFFEVEEGDVVVDVGASLGPFTYSILEKKPKHVFCFEPCEEEFPILIKNTMGHPVSHLLKGISSVNGVVEDNRLFNSVMGTQNKMETITFKRFLELYNLKRIDFLKTDCEGGEYDIFTDENFDFIKSNVKKIAGEWHLNEYYYSGAKDKFREFRDKYLSQFDKIEVYSVDGVDIKWDLWNEHFIEYYTEVIIYIDNR
jgi:autotransporter strand-loop-strand O-heptosyltransferase